MLSTMMNTPLGVTTLHRFGARHFASSRVGDYDGEQVKWRRYDEIDADSARLAHGLLGLGLAEGDRVGIAGAGAAGDNGEGGQSHHRVSDVQCLCFHGLNFLRGAGGNVISRGAQEKNQINIANTSYC